MNFFKKSLLSLIFCAFLPISLHATDLTYQAKKISTLSKQVHKLSYQIAPEGILSTEAKKLTKVIEELEFSLKATLKDINSTPPSINHLKNLQIKIASLIPRLDLIDKDVQVKFKKIEGLLTTKGFGEEVFTRHNKYVKEYQEKLAKLKTYLTKLQTSDTDTELKTQITEVLEYIEKELKVDNVYRPGPPPAPPELPERRLLPTKWEYVPIKEFRLPKGRLLTQEELEKLRKQSQEIKTIPKLTTPTKGDLDQTPDIQITQEIQDLAASLNNNPVKIYEWVRNNIDFVPYWGSFKGSQGTLIERSGNSFDISSLLMALLRASNIPCRYGSATVGMDIERLKNWLGAECPEAVRDIFQSGYIKGAFLVDEEENIVGAQFQHIFVLAYVPYGYYRGWSIDTSEKTWIGLDASFKQYDYIKGTDTAREVSFDFDTYYAGTQSSSPVEYYKELIEDQGINLEDIRRSRKIRQEKVWYLPANLPYKYGVRSIIYLYSKLNDYMRYLMAFDIGAGTFFGSRTVEFYGKRLTLSYEPSKDLDKELIKEGLIGLAYYRLIVKVEGKEVAEGRVWAQLGSWQDIAVGILTPIFKDMIVLDHRLKVGSYYSISLDIGGDASPIIQQRLDKLEEAIEQGGDLWQDDIIGELLYIAFLKYQNDIELKGKELEEVMYYRYVKELKEALTAQQIRVVSLLKLPANIELEANIIDAKYNDLYFVPLDGDYGVNYEKWAELVHVHDMDSSFQEHRLWEEVVGIDSISAVKVIQYANTINLPIHVINKDNLESELAQLQVEYYIKDWIRDYITTHPYDTVTIPEDEFKYNDWHGVGWITLDYWKARGEYIIAGYLEGGMTTEYPRPNVWITSPANNSY
ncbi:MAG: transglutaminase domain-containing protein, partial [bacterium]